MLRLSLIMAVLAVMSFTFVVVDASPQLMDKLVKTYTENTKRRLPKNGACGTNNLAVRKEWYVTLRRYLSDHVSEALSDS